MWLFLWNRENNTLFVYLFQVFPKGSPLAMDISEAILKVSENGKILELERHMLSFSNCSSSSSTGVSTGPRLGPRPFSGLFIVSGCISAAALLISTARLLERHSLILSSTQAAILQSKVSRWVFSLPSQIYTKFGFQFSRGASNINHGMEQSSMGTDFGPNQTWSST